MRRLKQLLCSASICSITLLISPCAPADDLLQVYHQALANDPTFAQAESTWQSAKMNLPIAEAAYLPQLTTLANATRQYNRDGPAIASSLNGYSWTYGYTLTLTQPVLNLAVWESIKGANASVKSATATYLAAQQSLMQRTASAYFSVLQAYDQLRYTVANKAAVLQQLDSSEQKFKVGLIAITDVYDARSNYDQITAQQIAAQNNLDVQLENLRAITNRHYQSLNGIHAQLPLFKPNPVDMEKWVAVANQQNYSIKAQNYAVINAMDLIKQQGAGDMPVLNLQAGVSQVQTANNPNNQIGIPSNSSSFDDSLGLNLAYNPIQGGLVIASTKQARYNYVTAAGLLEYTHRQVVDQTRTNFLNVMSGISQVKADKERTISAQNSVDATEAGLQVGTRTMVDVLNALTTLYQAEEQYATDQYTYINGLVGLKLAAGTLSIQDLVQINSWLKQNILFPNETSATILQTLHTKIKSDNYLKLKPNKKTNPPSANPAKNPNTSSQKISPIAFVNAAQLPAPSATR
ncbi:MAG: hypothetical protein A3F12_07520 [Gammaproteobacteria bacterium RIFCSPHIGHO2_12_FULL_38_14]|nr:MAG: hypothetical protein A3F12_07520 [Gammaproteobacteria bacterium RIFCSPHIGHO2_12_FULL_38_14]